MSMIAEIESMARKLKREQHDDQSMTYAFTDEQETWVATLRGLPFSCRLWQAYRKFDDARRTYAEVQGQRLALVNELRTIGRRLVETARDADPEAWGRLYLRQKQLELAIDDPHNRLEEAKGTADHAERDWGNTWQAYHAICRELSHQQQRGMDDPTSRGEQQQLMQQLKERKASYERPTGA